MRSLICILIIASIVLLSSTSPSPSLEKKYEPTRCKACLVFSKEEIMSELMSCKENSAIMLEKLWKNCKEELKESTTPDLAWAKKICLPENKQIFYRFCDCLDQQYNIPKKDGTTDGPEDQHADYGDCFEEIKKKYNLTPKLKNCPKD